MSTRIGIETAKEIVYERIFEWVEEKGEYCQDCDMRECTLDAYGTGDSPTLCECIAKSHHDCYGVDEELDKDYIDWFDGFVE